MTTVTINTLRPALEAKRVSDSSLVGAKNVFTELNQAEKDCVAEDIEQYTCCKGIGDHTTIEFQPIVKAVSAEWAILGGQSPVRSFEQLGRFRVCEGPNANKFIGSIYSAWHGGTKNDYCASNLRMRANCKLPSVNLSILPSFWEKGLKGFRCSGSSGRLHHRH